VKTRLRTALIWVALFVVFCSAIFAVGAGGADDVGSATRPILLVVIAGVAVLIAVIWFGRRVQQQ
jgi:4-amino-4-deoxy-L-arabinose transferase-like glycosyltransferase